jgi:sulfide:quinone oxidoreductase
LIAGGGVAGLEALHGLRALAGDRVQLTLIAPEDEFVYRPLAVEDPFHVGRVRQVPLTRAALQGGAKLVPGTVDAVDASRGVVKTSDAQELDYDALLVAVGASAVPVVANAMTWHDRADSEAIGGLLRDIDEGYAHSLAVVIPDGPVWPLRGYELALFVALEAKSMSADHQTMLITPRSTPLELLDHARSRTSRGSLKVLESPSSSLPGSTSSAATRKRLSCIPLAGASRRSPACLRFPRFAAARSPASRRIETVSSTSTSTAGSAG